MNRQMQRASQYAAVLLYTSAITLVYYLLYKQPFIGIDDANIYFKYVKNLVNGHGFVYNPGGERVEGFTSMLWVLMLSLLYPVGAYFETLVLGLNVVFATIILYKGIHFVNEISHQKKFFSIPAYLFLLIISLIPGYIDWTILTLMETSVWSFLLVWITLLLCRNQIATSTTLLVSVLLALLVFTRPESILWGIVFIAILFIRQLVQTQSLKKAADTALIPLLIFLIAFISLIMFRIGYFGYPLPNTFYAKVSSDLLYNLKKGLLYLSYCIYQSPLLALVLISNAFSLIIILQKVYRQFKERNFGQFHHADQIQFVLVVVSIISILIPVYVGGDHFKLLRFNQPFLPIYLFTFFNFGFWSSVISVNFKFRISHAAALLLTSVSILFIYFLTHSPLHTFRETGSPIDWEFRLAEIGRDEALKMNALFAPMEALPKIGVIAAGGFGYAYQGEVLDLMGLNNVMMAHANKEKVGVKNHAAFDSTVFYHQSPDIFHASAKLSFFVPSAADTFLLENEPDFPDMAINNIYKSLFTHNRFISTYSPVIIAAPRQDLFLKTYCRKDYIEKLKAKGIQVIQLKRLRGQSASPQLMYVLKAPSGG